MNKPKQVNIHEAKTHLSSLLASGEEIIIARAGVPIAHVIPIKRSSGKRILGSAKGKIRIADDFDAPLPKSILEAFYK